MQHQSIATTPTPTTTREERGIALYRNRGDEIEHLDGWRWRIPSCSGENVYIVDLQSQSCQCPDYHRRQLPCKHVYAGSIARAKYSDCDLCGVKARRRDLCDVPDDHSTLGGLVEEVCGDCGRDQGII